MFLPKCFFLTYKPTIIFKIRKYGTPPFGNFLVFSLIVSYHCAASNHHLVTNVNNQNFWSGVSYFWILVGIANKRRDLLEGWVIHFRKLEIYLLASSFHTTVCFAILFPTLCVGSAAFCPKTFSFNTDRAYTLNWRTN